MSGLASVGSANEVAERERIVFVERRLPMRGRTSLPSFWPDVEVRRFLIAQHGFLTLDMARGQIMAFYGRNRAPSRSTIGRFWKVLDTLERSR